MLSPEVPGGRVRCPSMDAAYGFRVLSIQGELLSKSPVHGVPRPWVLPFTAALSRDVRGSMVSPEEAMYQRYLPRIKIPRPRDADPCHLGDLLGSDVLFIISKIYRPKNAGK